MEKHRDIPVTIKGVPVEGGDVTETFASFKFYSGDNALVIAEIPSLSEEVRKISKDLLNIGGTITAIHNHWIFDKPKMYYIHWEMKGNAFKIMKKLDKIWSYL